MYESHFGFSSRPFCPAPDSAFLVDVPTMTQARDAILFCIRGHRGIAIVTAPAGLGKTLLCRSLAEELGDDYRIVLLANANFSSSTAMLQAVLFELGHKYSRLTEQELRLKLTSALRTLKEDDKLVVLIVDEAHLLDERLLEELRTLTNLMNGDQSLLRLVLAGQLGLEERLADPALTALSQRIGSQSDLEPLTREESAYFISERVRRAGSTAADVFTDTAFNFIVRASDGNPRCLNQLCDHALLLTFTSGRRRVTAAQARAALDDLKQLPLHWNDPGKVFEPDTANAAADKKLSAATGDEQPVDADVVDVTASADGEDSDQRSESVSGGQASAILEIDSQQTESDLSGAESAPTADDSARTATESADEPATDSPTENSDQPADAAIEVGSIEIGGLATSEAGALAASEALADSQAVEADATTSDDVETKPDGENVDGETVGNAESDETKTDQAGRDADIRPAVQSIDDQTAAFEVGADLPMASLEGAAGFRTVESGVSDTGLSLEAGELLQPARDKHSTESTADVADEVDRETEQPESVDLESFEPAAESQDRQTSIHSQASFDFENDPESASRTSNPGLRLCKISTRRVGRRNCAHHVG